MRAYSMDLRERVLLDSDAGMKAADVAAKYRVSGSWVRLLKQRRRDTGEVAPRVQRQGRRGMLEPHLHTVADLIAAHPAPTWDVAHLVFLDETGSTTNLLRRYGRAPRGARVHDHAPCGRRQTSTVLAAWRVTGLTAPGGLRRRNRWRELPRLHRTDPGADSAARRHRHCRQPRGPQGRRHPAGYPGRRGHPLVRTTL